MFAGNDVAEDGPKAFYSDFAFAMTASVATVQRLMTIALERKRRLRTVAFRPSLSVLWLRPCDGVTVAPERLVARQRP